ncbi:MULTISPECIES: DUF6578 domain-containing protein [Streptomyces diastaticus group]|uniref:DUF6578 domain-containing protein n=1 Tax=Streptomyces diastaticus group TaxID=2849069 RepID=UPI00358DBED3
MAVTIRVDDRQVRCRGAGFGPGDAVSWWLTEAEAGRHPEVVGAVRAAEVEIHEKHHGGAGEGVVTCVKRSKVGERACRHEVLGVACGGVRWRGLPGSSRSFGPTGGVGSGRERGLGGVW